MNLEAKYQETLNYLYGFVDFSLTRGLRISPEQFDLGRMVAFMENLGCPEKTYPILHVAGTKGKGSVAAMCANALQAAGYRVGLYTSPHLYDYAERIQLDGQAIPHAELIDLVDEIRPFLDRGTQLTTFEITTGLAFLYFARQKANAVVAEVGLGGRLDATNVITPLVSVITSISYDHTDILGKTLTKIAGEKAGIIKPHIPVVVAPQKEEARVIIEHIAAELSAPLTLVGRDYIYALESRSLQSQSFLIRHSELSAGENPPVRLSIPLLGDHQIENAATAYAALQVACRAGLPLDASAICQGFSTVKWPGRFEILQTHPPIVVDCAHNRDSASRLRITLDQYFPGLPIIMVFGASEDKDIEGMFAELMPRVQQVIATRSFHPRAIEPERLVEIAQRFGCPIKVIDSVWDAVREAVRLSEENKLILATGSIFVAAEARHNWYNLKEQLK